MYPVLPVRIAVLNSHPIQYFAPLYAYLNKKDDIEITALYLSDVSIRGGMDPGFKIPVKWDIDLLSGYKFVFVGSKARTRTPGGFWSLVAPEIFGEICSGRYDVLWINGHDYAANLVAMAAAKLSGVKVFMRCETHLQLERPYAKRMMRSILIGFLYGLCDRCLAIGTANVEFYRSIGIKTSKIALVPYAVDNDRFTVNVETAAQHRHSLRQELGIQNADPIVLYASKFERHKHPDDLIKSAHKLFLEGRRFHILMVGTGEMETELRELVNSCKMDNVTFKGFVNQCELPGLYAGCDVFVLPSHYEPWGLVINEAMCAGLPIVATEEAGSVRDLVIDGVNGLTFKSGHTDDLADALRRLVSDSELRERMSTESRRIILNWSYERCLQGLRSAIND